MALTTCSRCKRFWQANSGTEQCPWCRAETAEAKLQAAEEALREIYNGLVEINPNNHDEDDVFTQNNSMIKSIHIADAILAGHAPAPDHISQPEKMAWTELKDASPAVLRTMIHFYQKLLDRRESESTDRERRLEEALDAAAKSLETLSNLSGKDGYLKNFTQVRGYANNRALVARAALAVEEKEQAT